MIRFSRAALAVLVIAILTGISAATPAQAESLQQQLRAIERQHWDTTSMSYSPHGTQVEYLSRRGRAYLWYPGNTGMVKGRFKIDVMHLPVDKTPNSPLYSLVVICFKYGANTYNPITKTRGGDWECMPYSFYRDADRDIVSGDPFRLSKRRNVPFVLSRDKTSFSRLLEQCTDCR
ncbi:hypothetical protein [Cucumibacter marinus]|uniref:hypothetical protein n=1 Tax=Cucumibacter marinus TaxID=1121252 RepID=UPI0004904446|nr:hypothetical protein [Cucumibacter marinus]